MATLILAGGVPMLTAGDEVGPDPAGQQQRLLPGLAHLLGALGHRRGLVRSRRPPDACSSCAPSTRCFRRDRFRHGEFLLDAPGKPTGRRNLAWFGGRRTEMSPGEWHDGTRRTLGMYLACDDPDRPNDDALLIWFHGGADPVQVELPDGPWAHTYSVVAHTGIDGELPTEKISAGSSPADPGPYGRGAAGRLRAYAGVKGVVPLGRDTREPGPGCWSRRCDGCHGRRRRRSATWPAYAVSCRARWPECCSVRSVRRSRSATSRCRAPTPCCRPGSTAGRRPADDAQPMVINFHGGGFVLGNLTAADWLCGQLAARAGRHGGLGGLPTGARVPGADAVSGQLDRDPLAGRARRAAGGRSAPGQRDGRERGRKPGRVDRAGQPRPEPRRTRLAAAVRADPGLSRGRPDPVLRLDRRTGRRADAAPGHPGLVRAALPAAGPGRPASPPTIRGSARSSPPTTPTCPRR